MFLNFKCIYYVPQTSSILKKRDREVLEKEESTASTQVKHSLDVNRRMEGVFHSKEFPTVEFNAL